MEYTPGFMANDGHFSSVVEACNDSLLPQNRFGVGVSSGAKPAVLSATENSHFTFDTETNYGQLVCSFGSGYTITYSDVHLNKVRQSDTLSNAYCSTANDRMKSQIDTAVSYPEGTLDKQKVHSHVTQGLASLSSIHGCDIKDMQNYADMSLLGRPMNTENTTTLWTKDANLDCSASETLDQFKACANERMSYQTAQCKENTVKVLSDEYTAFKTNMSNMTTKYPWE